MKSKILLYVLLLVPALVLAGSLEEPVKPDEVTDDIQEEDSIEQPQEDRRKRGCGYKSTYFQGFCYHVSGIATSWDKAQHFCARNGGHLVKITSATENNFVLYLSKKHAPKRNLMWIGLRYWKSDKKFHWTDGSLPNQYSHWALNEPNGNAREPCSNMWTKLGDTHPQRLAGTWNDLPCKFNKVYPAGFVCKKIR